MAKESKYKPWMPDELIKLSKDMLLVEIADEWNVTRRTLHKWAFMDKDKPEFTWAYKRAKDRIFKNFILKGMKGLDDRHFNSRIWEHLARVLLMEEFKLNADLPGFSEANLKGKIKIIWKAAERGELKSTEVRDLIDSVRVANETEKFAEMEDRIAKLEKKASR